MNNVRDFGAAGDGKTKDTAAIQKAIDAGGMVYFPPGTYRSGTLYLRSEGGLDLSPGAVLLASPDKEDYNADDFCPQNQASSKEHVSGAHFIVALEVHNIVIRGGGRIDGNCYTFFAGKYMEAYDPRFFPEWRPAQMLFFCESKNITICDVELYNSPYWTCFLHGCESCTIHGVRIYTMQPNNGDGIGLDCCRHVTVSDCIIEGSDDCITLRGNAKPLKHPQPTEYVTVTNCVLKTRQSAIRVGVGNGLVRNCVLSNLTIHETNVGIAFCSLWDNKGGVTMENILFENIYMEAWRPIVIVSHAPVMLPTPGKPIRNISFRDMRIIAARPSRIEGDPSGTGIENVSFSRIDYEVIDRREQRVDGHLMNNDEVPEDAAAFVILNARDVEFDKVNIRWSTPSPRWRWAVKAENATVETTGCRFRKETFIPELR